MGRTNVEEVNKSYFIVYVKLTQTFDLSPAQTMLLSLIYSLSKKKGYCYSSRKDLSWRMNVSEATIYNLLKHLENVELIEKVGWSYYSTGKLRVTHYVNNCIDGVKEYYKSETE